MEEFEGGAGAVCLSHSGGVGVCLSSPLSHKQQRSSESFFPPYPFLTLLFIVAQVEKHRQHHVIRQLFTNKLRAMNTVQKL